MRLTSAGVLVLCLGGAGVAAAQPAATEPVAPPAPVAPAVVQPAPPPTTVDEGTLEDANAGRTWLAATALTPPKGTWSFSDYELFLINATYAVTDEFSLGVTSMVPVTSDFNWAFLSAKLQVVKQGPVRVALQAGVLGVFDSESGSNDSTAAFDLGGAITYCLDPKCFSHVDAFAAAGFARQDQSSVPVAFSAAFVGKLGRHTRLVLEADTGYSFGDISGGANGLLAWYGIRFTSKQIGVDAGLAKPICNDCDTDVFPLGFPVVTFTYRGLPGD